jgi:hypothetical protein
VDVTLLIEQADPDHRHFEVAHALQVIARQHPQASGIDRQGLVDAELGGEVGDRPGAQRAGVSRSPALAARQVLHQAPVRLVDAGLHLELVHALVDLRLVHAAKQGDRVVVHGAPELGVELAEQGADLGLPGPPEVLRQLVELAGQAVRGVGHRRRNIPPRAGLGKPAVCRSARRGLASEERV